MRARLIAADSVAFFKAPVIEDPTATGTASGTAGVFAVGSGFPRRVRPLRVRAHRFGVGRGLLSLDLERGQSVLASAWFLALAVTTCAASGVGSVSDLQVASRSCLRSCLG